jgi:type III pantothenate kinase
MVLLAIDVGNSTTVVGAFDGGDLVHHWSLATVPTRTVDEHALLLDGLLGLVDRSLGRDVHGVVVGSVVPLLTDTLRALVRDYTHHEPIVVEPGVRTGIALRHEHPQDLGADRIANAVAAHALYGGPAIVVDFGTAISFDVLDASGTFIGGAIAPGVSTAADALVERAARLPTVALVAPPSAIGRSTVAALQSGLVYGCAGQVDGLVERIAGELGAGVTTIATGGSAAVVLGACRRIDHHDPWLTLKGLRLVWERNA